MAYAVVYKVYPDHPESYKMAKVAEALRQGALILYPTDTVYALGCDPQNKGAVDRLRALKWGKAPARHLTLLCPSLADIAHYAYVDDAAYKLMRSLTPGPYTFILKCTKEVPKLVQDPKRKTAGLRVPDHPVCLALLERLGGLLVSSSAKMAEAEEFESREALFDAFSRKVDVIVDDGSALHDTPSTIIDLTSPEFSILREGLGMEGLLRYVQ